MCVCSKYIFVNQNTLNSRLRGQQVCTCKISTLQSDI